MEATPHIQRILQRLPDSPGVYQHYDAEGILLYIGKAKSLKKRVASYFGKKTYENGKTRLLVQKIADIRFIVVPTEVDALLLENSLIKEHQPRYNIELKDDKTYPSIVIRKERFPRVHATQQVIRTARSISVRMPRSRPCTPSSTSSGSSTRSARANTT